MGKETTYLQREPNCTHQCTFLLHWGRGFAFPYKLLEEGSLNRIRSRFPFFIKFLAFVTWIVQACGDCKADGSSFSFSFHVQ